jgi:hypothetical protein
LLGSALPSAHPADVTDRFVIRPDRKGFSVQDIWTGQVAKIAMVPQDGLSEEDPRHIADLLNRRARNGDRRALQ